MTDRKNRTLQERKNGAHLNTDPTSLGCYESEPNEARTFCRMPLGFDATIAHKHSPGGRKKIARRFIGGWCGRIKPSPARDDRELLSTPEVIGYFFAVFIQNITFMHSFVSC